MSAVARRLKPMFDRVLVERVEKVTRTKGGILLPENAQETVQEGVVVAVGPGFLTQEGVRLPMPVKEGDRVLLPDFGGVKVKLEKEYLLYKQHEILGVLSE
eukprot:Colp12_sorted_trinity150504_noHs@2512